MINNRKQLALEQSDALIKILKARFDRYLERHSDVDWLLLLKKLENSPEKLWSINEMEVSGGEPDVIGYDELTDEYIFCDCSAESPKGRRSICYDRKGLESRKDNKPENNAIDMAAHMGVDLLTEEQYIDLQKLGKFDEKTSSWIKTPDNIRKLGGALFANYHYGRVFVFYNGAQSYYAIRGFRGIIRV